MDKKDLKKMNLTPLEDLITEDLGVVGTHERDQFEMECNAFIIGEQQKDNVMKNKQEWFNEKMAAVSPKIMSEVQLSADIIARIDVILKQKGMTQRELAKKMGRSEAVITRWTSGFPNLTLKSIAEISTALGEPLIKIVD